VDKDLLAYLMAAFPDERETLREPDTRDYLTIRGYRVAFESDADCELLSLLSELQPGAQRQRRAFSQGVTSMTV
jgi:hypothetical protein